MLDPLPAWVPTFAPLSRLTHAPKHHLRQLGDRLADRVVLTTGEHAYRRPDGVAVVPLALLGP